MRKHEPEYVLRNCRECAALFLAQAELPFFHLNRRYCPQCRARLDEGLRMIESVLGSEERAYSTAELSQMTGIPEERIAETVHELHYLLPAGRVTKPCPRCGVATGLEQELCAACSRRLISKLETVIRELREAPAHPAAQIELTPIAPGAGAELALSGEPSHLHDALAMKRSLLHRHVETSSRLTSKGRYSPR